MQHFPFPEERVPGPALLCPVTGRGRRNTACIYIALVRSSLYLCDCVNFKMIMKAKSDSNAPISGHCDALQNLSQRRISLIPTKHSINYPVGCLPRRRSRPDHQDPEHLTGYIEKIRFFGSNLSNPLFWDSTHH